MNEWLRELAWCSGCEKELPRESFLSRGRWPRKKDVNRKCVKCRKEKSATGMWKCVQCLEAKPKNDAFKLWKSRSGATTKRQNTRCNVCVRKNDEAMLLAAWGLGNACVRENDQATLADSGLDKVSEE